MISYNFILTFTAIGMPYIRQSSHLKGGYRKIFLFFHRSRWTWDVGKYRNDSFGPKNDLKMQISPFFRSINGILRSFLGPNESFRLFSHHILCPTGPMKE